MAFIFAVLFRFFSQQAAAGIEQTGQEAALLRNRFSKPLPRQALQPKICAEIQDYFREDIALLSRLLDRDLSHWLASWSFPMTQ